MGCRDPRERQLRPSADIRAGGVIKLQEKLEAA